MYRMDLTDGLYSFSKQITAYGNERGSTFEAWEQAFSKRIFGEYQI